MLIKKSVVVCLLLVSLLVSVVCPCLISCSSSGETDAPARESNTAAGRNSGTDIAPEPALGYYIGNASTGVFHPPRLQPYPPDEPREQGHAPRYAGYCHRARLYSVRHLHSLK